MLRARFLPLLLLLGFVAAVGWRLLTPADDEVRSKLVGRPAPALNLGPALPGRAGVTLAGPHDGPRLVNFFASWCVPCIAEVPLLDRLKREGMVIDGIAVRDRPQAIAEFLERHGDPYRALAADPDSRAQLTLGSSGVPETFLIDARGIVRFQKIGAITAADLPALRRAWGTAR